MSGHTADILFGIAMWLLLLWIVGRERIRDVLRDFRHSDQPDEKHWRLP